MLWSWLVYVWIRARVCMWWASRHRAEGYSTTTIVKLKKRINPLILFFNIHKSRVTLYFTIILQHLFFKKKNYVQQNTWRVTTKSILKHTQSQIKDPNLLKSIEVIGWLCEMPTKMSFFEYPFKTYFKRNNKYSCF